MMFRDCLYSFLWKSFPGLLGVFELVTSSGIASWVFRMCTYNF